MQLSHFHFIFRDLVELKCLSSRLEFSSVVEVLDPGDTGFIGLNDFIRWIESVRIDFIVEFMYYVCNYMYFVVYVIYIVYNSICILVYILVFNEYILFYVFLSLVTISILSFILIFFYYY